MIVSRQTIAAELVRQTAIQPEGTPDETIFQATAAALAIPLALVSEAIDHQAA